MLSHVYRAPGLHLKYEKQTHTQKKHKTKQKQPPKTNKKKLNKKPKTTTKIYFLISQCIVLYVIYNNYCNLQAFMQKHK